MAECSGTWETCTVHRQLQEEREFVRDVVHDLKAPLRTLRTYYNEASRGAPYDFDTVNDAIIQMETMLVDLTDYASNGHVDMVDIDLLSIYEQVTAMQLPFEVITDCHLEDVRMLGNRIQVIRIINNLVENSHKYGATHAIISVSRLDPVFWQVSVTDDGAGIPADKREEVFTPLRRLHTWWEVPGTGLGLSVCRRIVEAHGGRIWIDDPPVGSTRVSFTLKAA
jgi:signal transduction histidine kinase